MKLHYLKLFAYDAWANEKVAKSILENLSKTKKSFYFFRI